MLEIALTLPSLEALVLDYAAAATTSAVPSGLGVTWSQFQISMGGAISGAIAAAVFAGVGFWVTRRARLRAHWRALEAEIEYCRELAETLLRDKVASPLYRLPTSAYQVSFPALLADAGVDEVGVTVLVRFYGKAEELNRGLEQANQFRMAQERLDFVEQPLAQEAERNEIKARSLVNELYPETIQVIKSHV